MKTLLMAVCLLGLTGCATYNSDGSLYNQDAVYRTVQPSPAQTGDPVVLEMQRQQAIQERQWHLQQLQQAQRDFQDSIDRMRERDRGLMSPAEYQRHRGWR